MLDFVRNLPECRPCTNTPSIAADDQLATCPTPGQTINLFWRCEGEAGAWWPALVVQRYTCDGGGMYAAGTQMLQLWYGARPAAGRPEPHVSYARFAARPDGSSVVVESIFEAGEEVEVELAWEVADEEVEFTAAQMLQLSEREVDDFGEDKKAEAMANFQLLPLSQQHAMLAGEGEFVAQQRVKMRTLARRRGSAPSSLPPAPSEGEGKRRHTKKELTQQQQQLLDKMHLKKHG